MTPSHADDISNNLDPSITVPLKFELFAASEPTSTGGTSLRYDSTAGQFIQNWKTPTGAGTCYSATMTAADGSSITAFFKLK